MMKKIIATICVASISTIGFAGQSPKTMTLDQPLSSKDKWCLNHNTDSNAVCPTAMGFQADKAATVVLYVNRTVANSKNPSDPINFNCNGVPNIVHPGNSLSCTLAAGESVEWAVENAYYTNGADGSMFLVE